MTAKASGDRGSSTGSLLDDWYREHGACHGFALDDSQQMAVRHLQRLYDDLLQAEARRRRWLRRMLPDTGHLRGVYLWGGVGRGKSFLMDGFFACAPVARKKRFHFHHFMQEVHAQLAGIEGRTDPLAVVARRIAREARLLCLDEFQVSDIGDAMLLGRLLEALLERGVVLVATSNSQPDDLYRHGLQRSRFLPAIALIKARLDVVHIDSGVDYRLRALEKMEIYHWPLDQAADSNLESAYFRLAKDIGEGPAALEVAGRRIMANHVAPGVAWFEFREICGGPRGQADYIELARCFHTVLIANVPRLGAELAAEMRRFTWLVDEFYDRRVKLIVSAEAPPAELCREGDCAGEFARTVSRLTEMQTQRYLAEAHLS